MACFDLGLLRRIWLGAMTAIALVSCGGSDNDDNDTRATTTTPASAQAATAELVNAFAATLTGGQQVPQNQSAAMGSGTIVLNPATRQVTATVTTTGLTGTTVSIEQGAPGVTGPVILQLTETVPGSGIWTGQGSFSDAQINALTAGETYFNVSSAPFTGGEIRGQIIAQQASTSPATTTVNGFTIPSASSAASITTFASALQGANVVPSTNSTAQGSGTVMVNPNDRTMMAAVTTAGIAGTTANIQLGAPGVNGPVSLILAESSPGSGVWSATTTLTQGQFDSLENGDLYFSVQSAAFPNGEIRGQIVPQRLDQSLITMINNIINPTTTTATPAGATTATTPAPVTGAATGTTPTIGTPATGGFGLGTANTGTIGTGTIGSGAIGTGSVGVGSAGIGSPPAGLTGTGTTGIGTTGFDTTGIGTTGTGLTTTGSTSTGLTGTDLTGTGLIGTTGMTGIGATGFGTSSTGLTGTGLATPTTSGTSIGTGSSTSITGAIQPTSPTATIGGSIGSTSIGTTSTGF